VKVFVIGHGGAVSRVKESSRAKIVGGLRSLFFARLFVSSSSPFFAIILGKIRWGCELPQRNEFQSL
jgi:hypothetical protein